MNALSHDRFSSVSSIAVASAIGQVVSFPRTVAVEPVAEVIAEPVVIAAEDIANDNDDNAVIVAPAFVPASALVDRKALARAVSIAMEAVEKRSTVPILSNVCLIGDGANLIVSGTDIDMEISVTIPAAVDSHFRTTIPGDLVDKLLKKAASSEYVSLNTTESFCKVDIERADFDLQSLSAADWPTLALGTSRNDFTMSGEDVWSMVDGVIDAVSTEETRYYLNGIYLHVLSHGNRRTIVATATDGHRLCSQETELPFGADEMEGVIIPRKTVKILHRLMKGKNCPNTVSISVNDSKIRISFAGVTITSKLVDGTFPDYQRVVPQNNSRPARVKASALIEAAETVSLISTERGRAVKLCFNEASDVCTLIVNNPDSGRAEMSIPCQFSGGEQGGEMEIGFNAGYLISAMKDASRFGDDITLTLEDSGSPTLITGARENWIGVLMPMRV